MSKDARIETSRVVVVGLGNPGSKYDGTRHNIGFDVVDELARRFGADVSTKRFKGLLGQCRIADRDAVLLKPQTFMNLSGESVGPCAGFYKLPPASVIVVHDDKDLDIGRARIKLGGGHGGHNGLRSLDRHLPDKNYFRVRVGVGKPPPGWDTAKWVLSRFAVENHPIVEELIDLAADAVERIIRDGLLDAQNAIHPVRID